jgi:hypothetical protein
MVKNVFVEKIVARPVYTSVLASSNNSSIRKNNRKVTVDDEFLHMMRTYSHRMLGFDPETNMFFDSFKDKISELLPRLGLDPPDTITLSKATPQRLVGKTEAVPMQGTALLKCQRPMDRLNAYVEAAYVQAESVNIVWSWNESHVAGKGTKTDVKSILTIAVHPSTKVVYFKFMDKQGTFMKPDKLCNKDEEEVVEALCNLFFTK